MPVSTSIHISYCLAKILEFAPSSVLDLGAGFGTWGFLCRTYLDVFQGRVQPESWEVRIDAIEFFEPYIQAHQRHLYNTIYIGDIREKIQECGSYDLVIAGDVIEHLEKPEAEVLLDILYEKAQKVLMVNIPLGEGWTHPEEHGNPMELHRSQWSTADFIAWPGTTQLFQLPCGEYGVFVMPKSCAPADRAFALYRDAERLFEEGRVERALLRLQQAQPLNQYTMETAMAAADIFLQCGKYEDALYTLRNAVRQIPDFWQGWLFYIRLLDKLQRKDDMLQAIGQLREQSGVPPAILEEVERLERSLAKKRTGNN